MSWVVDAAQGKTSRGLWQSQRDSGAGIHGGSSLGLSTCLSVAGAATWGERGGGRGLGRGRGESFLYSVALHIIARA